MTTPSQNPISGASLISGNYFIDHDYVYYTSIVCSPTYSIHIALTVQPRKKKKNSIDFFSNWEKNEMKKKEAGDFFCGFL